MSDNYDDNRSDGQKKFDDEKAWRDYRIRIEDEKRKAIRLEGSDYIALFIAALETIFLPLVILMIVLFGFAMILTFLV
ncbi:MAG: hypothetical protein ACW98Y_03720 [Candidatus Thorarchaeota archaeon]|jgi:hypothetical protein